MDSELRRKAIRKVILRKLVIVRKIFLLFALWGACTGFLREYALLERGSCIIGGLLLATVLLYLFICFQEVILKEMQAAALLKKITKWNWRKAIHAKIIQTKEGLRKEIAETEEELEKEIKTGKLGDLSLPENDAGEGTLALDETQGTLSLAQKKNSA